MKTVTDACQYFHDATARNLRSVTWGTRILFLNCPQNSSDVGIIRNISFVLSSLKLCVIEIWSYVTHEQTDILEDDKAQIFCSWQNLMTSVIDFSMNSNILADLRHCGDRGLNLPSVKSHWWNNWAFKRSIMSPPGVDLGDGLPWVTAKVRLNISPVHKS